MSIAGKFDNITNTDLLDFAKANNIKDAAEVIEEVVDAVAGWPRLATECGVPSEMINKIMPNMLTSISK